MQFVGSLKHIVPVHALGARLRALVLVSITVLLALAPFVGARADETRDAAILAAWNAYVHRDPQAIARGQDTAAPDPALRSDLLAPWLDYWAVKPALTRMTQADFDDFAHRHPGTYALDRLRDDWLLELGRRQDWSDFARILPRFRMRDDPQVMCYDLQRRAEVNGEDTSADLLALWATQPGGGAGCNAAARSLLAEGRIDEAQLWSRLRAFFRSGHPKVALQFAPALAPGAWRGIAAAIDDPDTLVRTARRDGVSAEGMQRELLVLALLRQGQQSPDGVFALLASDTLRGLGARNRADIAFNAARSAAVGLEPNADAWFRRAASLDSRYRPDPLTLDWMLRAALRAQDWRQVRRAAAWADGNQAQQPMWIYWRAIAERELGSRHVAHRLLKDIASPWTYYGQLATEALGQQVALPAAPDPLPARVVDAMAGQPGLARALDLFRLGIYGPAVREWNFTLAGRSERSIHAAAQLACAQQAWMLCISASEHTRGPVDWSQRYAMPYQNAVASAARTTGVSEAFIYGIIRQESRFAAQIQSWAGANGLMQLMPATAHWVAHKIGMDDYTRDRITDTGTNVTLGASYLGMLLQRFGGSEAMAAAGYNAGPGRPARWWQQDDAGSRAMAGAIFAENIPIAETRNYVQRVLANATVYAIRLGGTTRSLESRLGQFGPEPSPPPSLASLP